MLSINQKSIFKPKLIFSNLLETLQSIENPLTLEDFNKDNEFKGLIS